MKKKLSLINLNNNEVKKNGMKELLKEELGAAIGGAKCPAVDCWCTRCQSSVDNEYIDFDVHEATNEWIWLSGV